MCFGHLKKKKKKKNVRMLDATLLTYFVKISELNSQVRKVYQWNMQTRLG